MLSSGFTTDPPTLEDDLKIDSIYDHYTYYVTIKLGIGSGGIG